MSFKKLSQNLTIIVPTHERPISLKRQIDYIKAHDEKINILILDSSRKHKKEFKNNKNYFHIRGKNANIKISKILNKINTKYVVTIGDDDFLIFTSLYKYLKFLEKNKEYDAVHGEYLIHSKLLNFKLLNKYKFIHEEYPKDYKLKKNKKFLNAYQYINGYLPPLNYAVFRTKIFKKVWKLSTITKSESQVFLELVPSFMFYLLGNIKRFKQFYISREKSPRIKKQVQFNNEKEYKKLIKFIHFCSNKKFLNIEECKNIIKLVENRKINEISPLKKYKFLLTANKFTKIIKLIYIMLFKNVLYRVNVPFGELTSRPGFRCHAH